jgi:nitrogenase molybdenum-iron protein NifN
MRAPATELERLTGTPFTLLPTISGLSGADQLIATLAALSVRPVPARLRRDRARLVDAMLDGHFHFGGTRLAIAGEPDHLAALAGVAASLGAEIAVAVSATGQSPALAGVPADSVHVGDLGLMEELAREAGVDLIIANAHAGMAADALGVPLVRAGFPVFDRLGSQHQAAIGYAGTMQLIFTIANALQAARHHATPAALDPFRTGAAHDRHAPPQAH